MLDYDVDDLANALAAAVTSAYVNLPKTGKPQPNEYTVLAGNALFELSTTWYELSTVSHAEQVETSRDWVLT